MQLTVFDTQNRELNGDDLLVKQRALMSLCDILHDPENICQALRVGKVIPIVHIIFYDYCG